MKIIKLKAVYRIALLFTCSFSIYPMGFGQNGMPYISYFDTKEGFDAQNWSVAEDAQHTMVFANKKGLMRYDGTKWSHIETPYLPIKIKRNPYTNQLFILSKNNLGYLNRDSYGMESYVPLSYDGEIGSPLEDIQFTDSTIIIYGKNLVQVYAKKEHILLSTFSSQNHGLFKGLITSNNGVYINIEGKGFYRIANEKLIPLHINTLSQKEIIFAIPYNKTQILLGTDDNRLVLFNGKQFEAYTISNEEYLIDNQISDALNIDNQSIAISTVYGGVLIINSSDGRVTHTLNYENGLADDEIYSMTLDHNNGLWLTYEFGTARVDLGIPVKDYSFYPGIQGILLQSCWYENELYISTTEGLYYLSEVKNYEEVEVYLERHSAADPSPIFHGKNDKEREKDRGTVFRSLFKRNRDKKEKEEGFSLRRKGKDATPSNKPTYVKRKVSKLKSIEYIYKKVEGIGSRCAYLYKGREGLFAGTSAGLYLVQDHESQKILEARNIHSITAGKADSEYLVGSDEGLFTLQFTTNEIESHVVRGLDDRVIFSAHETDQTIWASSFDKVYAIRMETDSIHRQEYTFESIYPEELYLRSSGSALYLFSSEDIKIHDPILDQFVPLAQSDSIRSIHETFEYFHGMGPQVWIAENGLIKSFPHNSVKHEKIWGLFDRIQHITQNDLGSYWLIDDYRKIIKVNPLSDTIKTNQFQLFIERISNAKGEYFSVDDIVLEPYENYLKIELSAPHYLKNEATEFRYKILGRMEDWSTWSKNPIFEFYPEPGEYSIQLEAKNILDEKSKIRSLQFLVKTPFYKTPWFYLSLIPVLLGLFFITIYLRERKLKYDKKVLEEKVQERTQEIQTQKEHIEHQKDEILAAKNDITSSITYASRIQHAILPAVGIFNEYFAEHLVFFRPRDIVSGDFYWITEMNDCVIFAAADCTGHGVPGAFMSMLGNSFLNEITKDNKRKIDAGAILDELRIMITKALSQSGNAVEARDGMDIALCVYYPKKKQIEYAGAYNPLYIIRAGELTEYKASRMPIGAYPESDPFKSIQIDVQEGDQLYIFSDGYPDQFGGIHGKKYTGKRFKRLLSDISAKKMTVQQDELQLQLDYWQRHYEQVDDILILGVKI